MFKLINLVLLTSFACTSCCTMISNKEQSIYVHSSPQGASVIVDGLDFGTTPQVIELERKYSHVIQIEKEGYKTSSHFLKPELSSKIALNALTPIASGSLMGGIARAHFGKRRSGFLGGVNQDAMVAMGVLIGGLVGIIGAGVDLYAGSAKKLNVSEIHVELTQEIVSNVQD